VGWEAERRAREREREGGREEETIIVEGSSGGSKRVLKGCLESAHLPFDEVRSVLHEINVNPYPLIGE
jgi:hypothetical protein